MDFFDDILGRIIPIIIVFVIFRNLLTVLSGGKRPPQQEPEEETETAEYDPEGNPLDWEQPEEEESAPESAKSEEQQILDEFERMLRKPKEPPVYTPETAPEKPVHKEEQKVIRDEDTKVYREKPLIEEESIAHVAVTDVKTKSRRLTHGQLIQAVKWAEILAKPKGMR